MTAPIREDLKINIPFSDELENWLKSDKPKTLFGLDRAFAEKSFAVLFVILLAIPALPVPTGGLSHLFEAIAILIALQMVVGRRSLWLPKRWRRVGVGKFMRSKVMPKLIGLVRWLEKYSRPRGVRLLQSKALLRVYGMLVIIFSATAFVAIPFSMLDTLPALAVVLMSLAIILEDFLIFVVGLVVGSVGVGLVIALGKATFDLASKFF